MAWQGKCISVTMMTNNADIWQITKLYKQVLPKSKRMTLYPQANEH